ncbi:MAG: hypothetical protein ACPH2K_00300 [Flavicella sp.]
MNLLMSQSEGLRILTLDSNYEAGALTYFSVEADKQINPSLICSNSYGTILLNPTRIKETLLFKLPKSIKNKRGIVNWILIEKQKKLRVGKFNIIANSEVKTIDNYLGPNLLEVDNTNYAMYINLVFDLFDNIASEGTPTVITTQFLDSIHKDTIAIQNMISYKKIYSGSSIGKMSLSTTVQSKSTEEKYIDFVSGNPLDFEITAKRNHDYADGNQITEFVTSTIKDKSGNTVSDGTYVSFLIRDQNNNLMQCAATTIKGIASAKIVNPESAVTWDVKALITGFSESNSIQLTYKQSVKDFDILYKKELNSIRVGPIKSYMHQLIPNGFKVTLEILSETTATTLIETSFDGHAVFELPKLNNKKKYTFRITCAGIQKSIEKQ